VGGISLTTTDDLAHSGDVGGHAEVLLGATVADAEARHHLVEDKEGAVLVAERAETLHRERRRRVLEKGDDDDDDDDDDDGGGE
jgi:hypothetical protein